LTEGELEDLGFHVLTYLQWSKRSQWRWSGRAAVCRRSPWRARGRKCQWWRERSRRGTWARSRPKRWAREWREEKWCPWGGRRRRACSCARARSPPARPARSLPPSTPRRSSKREAQRLRSSRTPDPTPTPWKHAQGRPTPTTPWGGRRAWRRRRRRNFRRGCSARRAGRRWRRWWRSVGRRRARRRRQGLIGETETSWTRLCRVPRWIPASGGVCWVVVTVVVLCQMMVDWLGEGWNLPWTEKNKYIYIFFSCGFCLCKLCLYQAVYIREWNLGSFWIHLCSSFNNIWLIFQ